MNFLERFYSIILIRDQFVRTNRNSFLFIFILQNISRLVTKTHTHTFRLLKKKWKHHMEEKRGKNDETLLKGSRISFKNYIYFQFSFSRWDKCIEFTYTHQTTFSNFVFRKIYTFSPVIRPTILLENRRGSLVKSFMYLFRHKVYFGM